MVWFIAVQIVSWMADGHNSGRPHFWVELLTKHLFFITLLDNLRRIPLFLPIGKYLLPKLTVGIRDKHANFSREKVEW